MKINTFVIDFPAPEPKEIVTENDDGSYSVFINAKQSQEQQKQSWIHALRHISDDDFCKSDVQSIEEEAHKEKEP